VLVEGVAADVGPAIDHQHALAELAASRSARTEPAKPAPTIR
jgi:hypothetical protein